MLSKSLLEMTKGRFREFLREPSAFFFVLFMPIFWMLILGFTVPDEADSYRIGIQSSIQAAWAPSIEKLLGAQHGSNAQIFDLETLKNKVSKGQLDLGIAESTNGQLEFKINAQSEKSRLAYFETKTLIQESLGREDKLPSLVSLENQRSGRYIDFLIPGLLALSLFSTSLYGMGMTLVVNRREKLLKRYRVTPMSSVEFFASHILGRFLIASLEFLCIAIAGYFLFSFSLKGSWLSYILLCALALINFSALSILLGSRLSNSSAYNGIANLVLVPSMFLSGVWYSRSHYPDWLITLTDYLPLTAFVEGLRAIALEGKGLQDLYKELFVLMGSLLIVTVAARKCFKWY